ncbi:hypothetical protein AGMMS49992_09020 [Clostridia bacterium]|nr:hypothetical protein AGMMS49992_09020 [Clostridia bacterium]
MMDYKKVMAVFTAVVIAAGAFIVFNTLSNKAYVGEKQFAAIINAKIFDGENVIDDTTVVIKDGIIESVGGKIPEGAEIIDAAGKTLIHSVIHPPDRLRCAGC